MAGPADVSRGPLGEVRWARESARWSVHVYDEQKFHALMDAPERRYWFDRGIEEISGIRYRAAGKVDNPSLLGCTLEVVDGQLFIHENLTGGHAAT